MNLRKFGAISAPTVLLATAFVAGLFIASGLAASALAKFNIEKLSPTIWGKGKFAEMIVASGPQIGRAHV